MKLVAILAAVCVLTGCGGPKAITLTEAELANRLDDQGIEFISTNWPEPQVVFPLPKGWTIASSSERSVHATRTRAGGPPVSDLTIRIMQDPSILNVRNPHGESDLKTLSITRSQGHAVETHFVGPADEYSSEATFAHTATNVVDGVFLLYLLRYPESHKSTVPEVLLKIVNETKKEGSNHDLQLTK